MDEQRWSVLHVLTNQEKKVAQHLAVRSLEHYLPLYCDRSRWSDRTVKLERPLFSGYVFARFEPQTRLSVISTPGVLRLLGDEEHHTVSTLEIERIREGLVGGSSIRPHYGAAIGSRVRVLRGPFSSAEGVVTELRRQCKVILSLAATRQCFSLEADLADIDVLEQHEATDTTDRTSRFAFDGFPSAKHSCVERKGEVRCRIGMTSW